MCNMYTNFSQPAKDGLEFTSNSICTELFVGTEADTFIPQSQYYIG